jgi:hypothetical protein
MTRKTRPNKHGQKIKGETTEILSADGLGFDVQAGILIVLLWSASVQRV